MFHETFLLFPETRGGVMKLDGASYRGYLVMTARPSGLAVVNRLNLEDYVRGVVGNEIGRGGGPAKLEAQKAQAVAARTYAYIKITERGQNRFDLYDSDLDQVYTGAAGESQDVNRAVQETAGQLLYHEGRPAVAYYSSTCGGRTAHPTEVWNGAGPGHLKSVRDRGRGGDYCSQAARYKWRVTWDADAFMRAFRTYYPRFHPYDGKPFGKLRDVKIRKRGKSGRATLLEITTSSGRYAVERDAIRWTLRRPEAGNPALLSTYFDLDVKKRDGEVREVIANGKGYGHGVGLCQMGAVEMSRQGKSYRDILTHYFPGIEIRKLY